MKENGSFLSSFELEILMERLDKNGDEHITFNEVILLIKIIVSSRSYTKKQINNLISINKEKLLFNSK